MDNPPFSLKAQCYTILFNLTILSAQPLMIYSLAWLLERYYSGRDLNVFFIFLFFLPLVWFIGATILSIISWKISTYQHRLIRTFSKESFNLFLSITLLLLVIDITTIAIIYFFGYIDAPDPIGSIYIAGVFANLIILLSAFLIIVYASIRIIQRKMYQYPCLIRVVSNSSPKKDNL
jgi:uncharacterized Tic20 family protein